MKKKKGFTLIELIAVLVIMAIIALIVTPLVMTIIRKAKDSAAKRSVDAYGRSIDIAIAGYILDNAEFPDSLDQLNIEYSGKEVTCGIMSLNEDSGAYLSECSVGNYKVKDSTTNDGWYHYEAKNMVTFDYKIGDTVTYKGVEFQVIKNSKKGDATVALIKSTPLTSEEITALGEEFAAALAESVDGYVTLGENINSADYSNSLLKRMVYTWATTNSMLVNVNDNVRLVTYDELTNNLKYVVTASTDYNGVSQYVNGSVAWTEAKLYWGFTTGTNIGRYGFTSTSPIGSNPTGEGAFVRPVIEIQKSSAITKN